MKKNTKKILLVFLTLFLLTGCTQPLKNEEGKAVQNKETGQPLTANILCRPESKETIARYEETKLNKEKQLKQKLDSKEITQSKYESEMEKLVDINDLPKCQDFSVNSGGYEGIWTTIFVKPLAWVILKIGELVNSYGLALMIITILLRLIMYPVTKKTAMQSENLKSAKPEIDKIEKKYKNRQDQESMMMKSQETLALYKKYHINPMSGCLFGFIQIPLFFAFYEGIMRLPAIFEETMLGFQLGTNPLTAIVQGKYYYIIFIILIIAATYFSFKLNSGAAMSSEQEKQMKMMSNIMVVMISIMSFSLATGVAVYWITNSTFTIVQNLLVKRRKKING